MTPYYQDDFATIYHGDCREVDAWLAASFLLTDPPYGIGWRQGTNKARGSSSRPGIANDHDTLARDWVLSEWGDRPGAVFGSFYAPLAPGEVLVWAKARDAGVVGSTSGHRRDVEPVVLIGPWPRRTTQWSAVLRSTEAMRKTLYSGHPHAKPVDMLAEILRRFGHTDQVADPFMGSGSTLVAAKSLGRKAIGIELEERYCEVAAKRLAQEVLDFGGVA